MEERADKRKQRIKGIAACAAALVIIGAAALWVGYDTLPRTDGRTKYEIVNDEYPLATQAVDTAHTIEQRLTLERGEKLYGVRLKPTVLSESASGTIELALRNTSGVTLASATRDMVDIREDDFLLFLFNKRVEPVAKTRYILTITAYSTTGDVAFMHAQKNVGGFAMEQNGTDVVGTLALQLALDHTDGFLGAPYRFFAALLVICALGSAALLYFTKTKAHTVFALSALALGFVFCFLTPELCVPDEAVHYSGSYSMVNDAFGTERAQDAYSLYMRSCDVIETGEQNRPVRNNDVWAYKRLSERLWDSGISGECDTLVTLNSAVPAANVMYLPSALGIGLSRVIGLGGGMTMIFGRLFNLIVYVVLAALAIKYIPFGKNVMFVVGMFPMCLQLASSFSPDAPLIGMCFLFTALCLKAAYSKDKPSVRLLVALAVLAAGICVGKSLYVVLVALAVILLPKYVKDRKKALLILLAVLVLGALAGALLLGDNIRMILTYQTDASAMTEQELAQTIGENGESSMLFMPSFVLAHPAATLGMLAATAQTNLPLYLQEIIGGRLGEPILVNIEINWIYIIILLIAALAATLRTRSDELRFDGFKRGWGVFVALGVFAAVVFVCMTWTPINYGSLYGLQGRYLLPAVPLLLLSASSDDGALRVHGHARRIHHYRHKITTEASWT